MSKKNLLFIFSVFLLWRLCLHLVQYLGLSFPLNNGFLGGGVVYYNANPMIWAWSNFDGYHYLSMAQNGYGSFQQAFFPFYPILIKLFSFDFGKYTFLIPALTISHIFSFLSFVFLYLLFKIDYNDKIIKRAFIFLILFPTSFFLISAYTESLFLFLTLGSFLLARKDKWLLAGIFGLFASLTRLPGIFLFPALLWEFFLQNRNKSFKISNFLPLFLVPMGTLIYMIYLQVNYNDALLFMHVQPNFGAQRSVDHLILFPQVIWRYLRMIFETKINPIFFTVWLELILTIFNLILLFVGLSKKMRGSYMIFAFLSFFVPTLTGTFSSMPRYQITIFPIFIISSLVENKILRYLVIIFNTLLLVTSCILFTRGYFVS